MHNLELASFLFFFLGTGVIYLSQTIQYDVERNYLSIRCDFFQKKITTKLSHVSRSFILVSKNLRRRVTGMTRRSKEIAHNTMEGERKFVVPTNTEIMYLTLTWEFFLKPSPVCIGSIGWHIKNIMCVRVKKTTTSTYTTCNVLVNAMQ